MDDTENIKRTIPYTYCRQCDGEIYKGTEYLTDDNLDFCNVDCLKDYYLERFRKEIAGDDVKRRSWEQCG